MESCGERLITKEKDGKMRIDHDALRHALIQPQIGDCPIAIISIAGCMRSGKSFLLNFVQRYLRNEGWRNSNWMGDGHTSVSVGGGGSGTFPWKSGRNRTTTGVRMSREVFKIPRKDGGQVAVLLMDTQGLFDHETPEDTNVTLLTLSTLISSVQIFNAKEQLNSHDLRYLKTCVDYAMATALTKEPYFMLQDLLFLVRDFADDVQLDGFDCPFGFDYGESYLKDIIDAKAGGEEQIKIRQRIKECFTRVKCFPMPDPGKKVKQKGFKGRNDEIENDFKKYVKIFVEYIAHPDQLQAKIARKSPMGKEMTAREILNMVAACDNIFAMKMFTAQSIMGANVKAYYASEYEEAICEYDKSVKGAFDGSRPVEKSTLKRAHSDAIKRAFRRFDTAKKMGDVEVEIFYRKHLREACDEHFSSVKERNNMKHKERDAQRTIKTAAAFSEYESNMQKYSADPVEDEVLKDRHKLHLNEVKNKYEGKADEDSLHEKAELHLSVLMNINTHRRSLFGEDKRKNHLLRLNAQLHDKCTKFWMEKLKTYQSDRVLFKHQKIISDEITTEFFKKALSPEELSCMNKLNNAMKKAYNKAKEAVRHRRDMPQLELDELSDEIRQLSSEQKHDKKDYAQNAHDVAALYAREMQKDTKNGIKMEQLKLQKRKKQKEHRKMFCMKGSKDLVEFCEKIEQMLAERSEEAKKRNEKNWDIARNEMVVAIDARVLAEDEELQAAMADRYIETKELENHFQHMKKDFSEKVRPKLLDLEIPHVAQEFKNLVNEKVEALQKKVEQTNENNKEVRHVQSVEVPKSKSWFTVIKKKVISTFGKAGNK